MRGLLIGALAWLLLGAAPAAAQAPLKLEVLRTSAGSLYSNVTLIEGEHDAVLVDPPLAATLAMAFSSDLQWCSTAANT